MRLKTPSVGFAMVLLFGLNVATARCEDVRPDLDGEEQEAPRVEVPKAADPADLERCRKGIEHARQGMNQAQADNDVCWIHTLIPCPVGHVGATAGGSWQNYGNRCIVNTTSCRCVEGGCAGHDATGKVYLDGRILSLPAGRERAHIVWAYLMEGLRYLKWVGPSIKEKKLDWTQRVAGAMMEADLNEAEYPVGQFASSLHAELRCTMARLFSTEARTILQMLAASDNVNGTLLTELIEQIYTPSIEISDTIKKETDDTINQYMTVALTNVSFDIALTRSRGRDAVLAECVATHDRDVKTLLAAKLEVTNAEEAKTQAGLNLGVLLGAIEAGQRKSLGAQYDAALQEEANAKAVVGFWCDVTAGLVPGMDALLEEGALLRVMDAVRQSVEGKVNSDACDGATGSAEDLRALGREDLLQNVKTLTVLVKHLVGYNGVRNCTTWRDVLAARADTRGASENQPADKP